MAERESAGRPSSFGVAFAMLPPPQRDAIRAVHAWSRSVDDGVDLESSPSKASEAIERWRREVAALYDGTPRESVTLALRPHVRRFAIPREYLDELVNGVEMDLRYLRYATFPDLTRYCYRVASVVGLICLRIFGDAEERGRRYAEELGLALQLTNILRDIGSDLDRGHVYLPEEEMDAHGVTVESLTRRERSEAFLELMRFQAARVRGLFEAADREVDRLDRTRLLAAEIMARVYRRLLDRIEVSGFDVLERTIRVPRFERIWIAARTTLAVRVTPSPAP